MGNGDGHRCGLSKILTCSPPCPCTCGSIGYNTRLDLLKLSPSPGTRIMLLTRKDLEEREKKYLAPYAAVSSDGAGREHAEPPPEYRTHYQRDWNRIAHSPAYRKLKFKTQVFPFGQGDDASRDRLTHTLETVQIATSIARSLGLNEDLTRAIAMAHDIGHPPFGHAGEYVLNRLAAGFDHNDHGLKILRTLEKRYPGFDGLNLTLEVLEGIEKHETIYDHPSPRKAFFPGLQPTMEAQAVCAADVIAFHAHDLEDALRLGILTIEQMNEAGLALWEAVSGRVAGLPPRIQAVQRTRALINLLVRDVLSQAETRLEQYSIKSLDDVRNAPGFIFSFTEPVQSQIRTLGKFLHDNFYQNYKIIRMINKGETIIERLYGEYSRRPEVLPAHIAAEVRSQGTGPTGGNPAIADYIAGMTDRYATEEYCKIFEVDYRV
ncbi:MAG: deoxyguanosinetriphosphate triphosphohydrolase [Planctomycetota bacterium]|nr:MAG: deoxyguanosinetriphosphate triphosphohydrolase [Planctomycetota bacterium]